MLVTLWARSSWMAASSEVTVTDHTKPSGPSTRVSVPSATSAPAPTWKRSRTVGRSAPSTTSTWGSVEAGLGRQLDRVRLEAGHVGDAGLRRGPHHHVADPARLVAPAA